MAIIHGDPVGNQIPRANWNEKDPTSGSYIQGDKPTMRKEADGNHSDDALFMSGKQVKKVADPTDKDDVVTKSYADGYIITAEKISVPAASFKEDSAHKDFPYKAEVPVDGIKASMFLEVVFSAEDSSSGIFASSCESYDGGVCIYANEKPIEAITIPTVVGWRVIK